ncbi:hypothetical protein EDF28_2916 [Curtobacterium sp. PhB137]|nr:hypothetical protein EDF28_2916 [Curtobacterium sp. PhB137]
MAPALALASCESALRQLLDRVFVDRYGADWASTVFTVEKRAKLEELRDVERKKRHGRGVAVVAENLLQYTNFYDLRELVRKQWDLVAPALKDKAVITALLTRFDDLRNTVAHSRELLPFEKDLLSGIAGEIRNRITIYMSTQAPTGEFYARIESIVDSFGNEADAARTLVTANPPVKTGQVLHPGDVVTFRCRGWDPQGRTLTWTLTSYPLDPTADVTADGDEVELTWVVTEKHVAQQSVAFVRMKSSGEYLRWAEGVDGMTLFYYRVDPPIPVASA